LEAVGLAAPPLKSIPLILLMTCRINVPFFMQLLAPSKAALMSVTMSPLP
jgi:hypothetical protein